MTRPAISVQNLRQGYRKRAVFDELSFEVPAGTTFALLGRNGAGKTTLIRTLLGLLHPMQGTVEVLGRNPVTSPQQVRQHVGYLAEDQEMYGWMDAGQISTFLAPFYPGWDQRLLRDLLDRFEVPRGLRIKRMSKGETIRLALALSLAHRPELVILDDPALGLDPISRKQFNRDVIEHLQAEGRTVFNSSHLLYEVQPMADSVAILDRGGLVRVGQTEELQREVKRVLIPSDALENLPRPRKLLDVRIKDQVALIVVDDAPDWLPAVDAVSAEYQVEDLSLDDIFEAYVIGDVTAWPESASPMVVASV
jgi:ABC-2 type transport system ATP-binding protein